MKHETEFSPDVYISSQEDDSGCRELWVSILARMVLDLDPTKKSREAKQARIDARYWFDHCGRDFELVCTLAGFDPEAVRDAYRSGKINYEAVLYHRSAMEAANKGKRK